MKVLLTGGAGFIGSHTAVELLQAGHDVVIVDDYSNSEPDVAARIEQITGKPVPAYALDVKDAAALSEVFEKEKVDAVIHFAGYKAVGESVKKPLKYYRNNLDTSLTLLEVMEAHGVKKVVFSSSATVYGAPADPAYHEGMVPGGCSNPYGWTKLMVEQVMMDAAAADPELSVVLLRYFNPIGAHTSGLIGEKPNGIPNNLMPYITQVAAGILDHLNVFGDDYPTRDGSGVRDYIHVVDLARGHVAALDYAAQHKGAEAFNLGTGRGCSVLEVVAAFEKANGLKIPYEIAPRRAGDLAEYFAVPDKAEKVLGWKARLDIEDMCRDAWNWQKNQAKK